MTSTPAGTGDAITHRQRLGIAAVEELRQSVHAGLHEICGGFVRQFAAALLQNAAQITNATEQRLLQELARGLTGNATRWVETFVQHVDAHLTGGEVAEAPGTQAHGADDTVMLANVQLRAEARFRKLVTELDARVNRLRLMLYMPVYTKALAPTGLCRALVDTAGALEWPVRQRKLLVERFDTLLVPALEPFYKTQIDALVRIAEQAAANAQAAPPPPPPPRRGRGATQMAPPPDPTRIDEDTQAMLQTFALRVDGAGYTDGLLAADLLALADHRPLPGVTKDQSWVPLQRIANAGHFLNEVIADPMVPDEQKAQHEKVRLPLVKSALTDESLFTSATHPLGSLVNELLLKSAASRVNGSAETRRMAELLQQVVTQFDLAPEFVREMMQNAPPIPETQMQRFFELQRQQAQQRRDFVIAEAKRVVLKQLEHSTFGRGTPQPAVKFLHAAWGPLLTKRVLQHGADHALWKAGLALMEQLLDVLDVRQPEDPPSAEWTDLLQTMGKALVAEGMPADRARIALGTLEAARKTPPSDSPFG
ncbi:MAG TPA: DUF1631 family protein [Candidatus Binatia bacterium]|nr:DUF1631 family protein [Candidatus Binatia bacterium]